MESNLSVLVLFLCWSNILVVRCAEPLCPQGVYEQKLLERLVQLEHRLQATEERLNDKPSAIAFTASISQSLTNLKPGQTVVYNLVETNVGSSYNQHTGHFTCPRSGLYLFTLTTLSESGKHLQLDLVLNGRNVISVTSQGPGFQQSSNSKVLHVNQGEALWVRVRGPVTDQIVWADNYSGFAGYLISAD